MLKTLNFKHIFYFWVVGKESSIRKASILLNISPSSISEQIKTLEERVGDNLFDRSQKKMKLTLKGKIIFDSLDNFFPTIEELFESLINHKSTDVKFLRIGLCPTLSDELRFKLCFPYIKDIHYTVKILQGENDFLLNAFNQNEIDLLFTTNNNLSIHGKNEKVTVAQKKFLVVANSSVHKKLPSTKQIEALSEFKYINYTPDSDLHFKILDFMHTKKISPTRIGEIDDIGLIKRTLINLECFSILPMDSVQRELKEGKLHRIGRPLSGIDAHITAIYKSRFKGPRFESHLTNIKNDL